jgi:hypothetical protein
MATTQEFFTREHERLMKLETSIVKTRSELESARTEALDSLKAKRSQMDTARDARHKQLTDASSRMQQRMDARKQESAAAIEEWKHKREVHKLEKRASDAETYADSAMAVLEVAQEEARAASLEAIEARREAHTARATRWGLSVLKPVLSEPGPCGADQEHAKGINHDRR